MHDHDRDKFSSKLANQQKILHQKHLESIKKNEDKANSQYDSWYLNQDLTNRQIFVLGLAVIASVKLPAAAAASQTHQQPKINTSSSSLSASNNGTAINFASDMSYPFTSASIPTAPTFFQAAPKSQDPSFPKGKMKGYSPKCVAATEKTYQKTSTYEITDPEDFSPENCVINEQGGITFHKKTPPNMNLQNKIHKQGTSTSTEMHLTMIRDMPKAFFNEAIRKFEKRDLTVNPNWTSAQKMRFLIAAGRSLPLSGAACANAFKAYDCTMGAHLFATELENGCAKDGIAVVSFHNRLSQSNDFPNHYFIVLNLDITKIKPDRAWDMQLWKPKDDNKDIVIIDPWRGGENERLFTLTEILQNQDEHRIYFQNIDRATVQDFFDVNSIVAQDKSLKKPEKKSITENYNKIKTMPCQNPQSDNGATKKSFR